MDHQQCPNEGLRELALFAGAGGGILGGKLLGWRTVCAVEWNEHARKVLAARQDDGHLDPFPIWDDVQTFDGTPWRGRVDIVTGGFPCQDISSAGKGAGIEGERSGMWKHMARIVGQVVPRFVFVENSPLLVGRGLAMVLGDLAAMGYDARWGVLGAHHVGSPHQRERVWVLAYPTGEGMERQWESRGDRIEVPGLTDKCYQAVCDPLQGTTDPGVFRVVNVVANRVDRTERIGNGQVPAVVRLAWQILSR